MPKSYSNKKKSLQKHTSDDDALQLLSTEFTDQSSSAQTEGTYYPFFLVIFIIIILYIFNIFTDIPHSESATHMKVRKQKSWIWKYTTLIQVKGQPDRYKCMYCKKTFLRNGTGVISRHLMNMHNNKIKNTPTPCSPTNSKKSAPPFKVGYLYSVP